MPRSKLDPVVERLVNHAAKELQLSLGCPGDETCRCRVKRKVLRALLTEARESAARECAQIVEREAAGAKGLPANRIEIERRDAVVKAAKAIRERFYLEGK